MVTEVKIREDLYEGFKIKVFPHGVVHLRSKAETYLAEAISVILEDNPNLEPRGISCTATKPSPYANEEHFYMAILILVEKGIKVAGTLFAIFSKFFPCIITGKE